MAHTRPRPDPSICITVDYELFGDGSGDIATHLLQPTARLLRFLADAGLRATFLVEVAELLAFQDALTTRRCPSSLADDYDRVVQQIGTMMQQGHDVQLHIHPQWFNARWDGDQWKMDSHHYSLLQYGTAVLADCISDGKRLRQQIGYDAGVDVQCRVFRAGGLHLDRVPSVTSVLSRVGFAVDSSVCRGRKARDASIDYRDLTEVRLPYWLTIDGGPSPASRSRASLVEIPVWSVVRRQYRKLSYSRIKSVFRKLRRRHPDTPQGPADSVSWLLRKQAVLWDFCLLAERQMIHLFREALSFHETQGFFPLVMIGHSKELRSLRSLHRFTQYVHAGYDQAEWITLSAALDKIERGQSRTDEGVAHRPSG